MHLKHAPQLDALLAATASQDAEDHRSHRTKPMNWQNGRMKKSIGSGTPKRSSKRYLKPDTSIDP
jgi:hypothetical protein